MPFTTGTADTAVDLQVELNTHLVANGWTNIAGETDQNCVVPISARYWRLTVQEPDNFGDFIEIELLHFRETVGGANVATNGANWSLTNIGSGTGANLVSGTTTVRSIDLNNGLHTTYTYDFGSPQIVREMAIKSDTGVEAPEQMYVHWSNDGVTWTLMEYIDGSSTPSGTGWSNNETRVWSWPDGYIGTDHFSGTRCRRSGYNSTIKGRTDHGIFAWQGPGYDAARRVYINTTCNYDLLGLTERWVLGGGTDFDVNSLGPSSDGALGADTVSNPRMIMPLGPFTYWIYSNSLRVIVVVKNGLDDYIYCYMGFLKAFGQPDDYSHPLYIAGAHNIDLDVGDLSNSVFSVPHDPGDQGMARARLWEGSWVTVSNRSNSAVTELRESDPSYFVWPLHSGGTGDGRFPFCVIGDNDTANEHWMDQVVPTAQNESPMWPCTIWSDPWGAIGALDGVYALPRAGIYSAEQVLTVSGQDYRVFTNRNRSFGNSYFAIRED